MKTTGIQIGALALLLATATGSAPAVQTQITRAEALPTARVCSLEDFGTPLPTNPRVTPEPMLFQDMGRIAEWTDGSLYSTGPQGGSSGLGAAFRMTPAGTLDIIGAFDGTNASGAGPQSGLVDGGDGYLYGTSRLGGKFKTGTIFRLDPKTRSAKTLIHFRNGVIALDDGDEEWNPEVPGDPDPSGDQRGASRFECSAEARRVRPGTLNRWVLERRRSAGGAWG